MTALAVPHRPASLVRRALLAALAAAVMVPLLAPLVAPIAPGALAPLADAADGGLTLTSDARYVVQPDDARVRVTLDLTARFHRPETATRKFYLERAYLAVQPKTTAFAISGESGPRVSVARREKDHTLLRIDFGKRLYSGRSLDLKLRFDLPDPGGSPSRQIRIGDALVSFPVWAFASDGASGGSVAVTFPSGYDVEVVTGELPDVRVGDDGRTVLRSGRIERPTAFLAFVVADRPGAYAETTHAPTVAGTPLAYTLRAWRDDEAWAERVGGLLDAALPVLGEAIGQPWTLDDGVLVEEAASIGGEGHAGLVEPAEGRIRLAYYASTQTVLHEAAHGWFNGRLVADRWAAEAFAALYAERAAAALDIDMTSPELTDELREAAFPLNAWGEVGADPAADRYGYAASLALARAIAERAGDDALREVWASIDAGIAPYQPLDDATRTAVGDGGTDGDGPAVGGPITDDTELLAAPPDWRGLLDLLEERTGESFDDLWREWVVRPEEAQLLDARAEAMAQYARTVALTDGWAMPAAIRSALRAWRFDVVTDGLADVRAVLAQRRTIEAAALSADVDLPTAMQEAFEAGDLGAASETAVAQLAVIEHLRDAQRARPLQPDPIAQLGLAGTAPEADLERGAEAFAAGDLETATEAADRAYVTWDGAWDLGRRRVLIGVVIAAVAVLFAGLSLGGFLGRRGGSAETVVAEPVVVRAVPAAEPPAAPIATRLVRRPRRDHDATAATDG